AENCLTTALGEVNLNNQAEALKAIVFPNPANDYIDIQFLGPNSKPLTVELFDVSGRMVQKSRIAAKATTARLETTLVHSGTYLLKISSEHAVTSKIVMIAK
ncbi:MAG: T9SS type A sorting domain-containing protein, partial [Saprospiraceae bacterium]